MCNMNCQLQAPFVRPTMNFFFGLCDTIHRLTYTHRPSLIWDKKGNHECSHYLPEQGSGR